MWGGRGGGDGGGGSAELNPSFRFRMSGGPGSMLPVGQDMKLLGTVKLLENTAKLVMHEGLELITAGKLAFLELEKIK